MNSVNLYIGIISSSLIGITASIFAIIFFNKFERVILLSLKNRKEKKNSRNEKIIHQILELNENKDWQNIIVHRINNLNHKLIVGQSIFIIVLFLLLFIMLFLFLLTISNSTDITLIRDNNKFLIRLSDTFNLISIFFFLNYLPYFIWKQRRKFKIRQDLDYLLSKAFDDEYIESIKEKTKTEK